MVFYDLISVFCVKNEGRKFLSLGVLVGAFSDFGGLDTDNPVQISRVFRYFTPFSKSEGLI